MKPVELTKRVIQGYTRALRWFVEVLAVIAGMTGIAVCIAYPVWWLATNRRGVYTALVAGGCAIVLAVVGIKRLSAGKGVPKAETRVSRVLTILVYGLFVVGAYGASILMIRSIGLGIAAAVSLAALFGIWKFGYGKPISRGQ